MKASRIVKILEAANFRPNLMPGGSQAADDDIAK
jgi:hypothetical protein